MLIKSTDNPISLERKDGSLVIDNIIQKDIPNGAPLVALLSRVLWMEPDKVSLLPAVNRTTLCTEPAAIKAKLEEETMRLDTDATLLLNSLKLTQASALKGREASGKALVPFEQTLAMKKQINAIKEHSIAQVKTVVCCAVCGRVLEVLTGRPLDQLDEKEQLQARIARIEASLSQLLGPDNASKRKKLRQKAKELQKKYDTLCSSPPAAAGPSNPPPNK